MPVWPSWRGAAITSGHCEKKKRKKKDAMVGVRATIGEFEWVQKNEGVASAGGGGMKKKGFLFGASLVGRTN